MLCRRIRKLQVSVIPVIFDRKLTVAATTNIAQTMRDSSVNVTLPDLNISLSTIYPFKRKKRQARRDGMRRFQYGIRAV